VLPSAGTFNFYEMSAREKESTKKEKISKKEIKFFSNNKRMLNKKEVNTFRIIVTTKMAEIFELKILGKIVFSKFSLPGRRHHFKMSLPSKKKKKKKIFRISKN
jgi:S-ribosylhomocysteine lyase LuxS involved in autoinducer biosynthesis